MGRQEVIAVGNRIEGLLSRMVALEARFATLPGNVGEQRRRHELIRYAILLLRDSILNSSRKLGGIEGKLRSLHEKPGLQQITDHIQDNENVLLLLEDLRETISDYQVRSSPWHHSQC